jgi:hypothetical protein
MFKVCFPEIYPNHNRVLRKGFDKKRLLSQLQLLSVRGSEKPRRNEGLFLLQIANTIPFFKASSYLILLNT